MKLKDWLRAKKEKRAAKKQDKLVRKLAAESPEPELLDADTEGIEPPETRFTDEYREFLEREAAITREREAAITHEQEAAKAYEEEAARPYEADD